MRRIIILAMLFFSLIASMTFAREPDLAGTWYPSDSMSLKNTIDSYMNETNSVNISGRVVGVIAPHAGIQYSGPVAVYSYNALKEADPSTVVIVGFTHRKYIKGTISVLTDDVYKTPVGDLKVDKDMTSALMKAAPEIRDIPEAFDSENSIELQMPFIREVLGPVNIVAIAICDQSIGICDVLANALTAVLKGRNGIALVASSDMYHYKSYDEVNAIDSDTIKEIKKLDPRGFYIYNQEHSYELMCGFGAAYTVMKAAMGLGANSVKVLDHANSGDTSGMRDKVVGYLSAAFIDKNTDSAGSAAQKDAGKASRAQDQLKKEKGMDMLDHASRKRLLEIARNSIKFYLKKGIPPELKKEGGVLGNEMGAFVTLYKNGELRGCIGHMIGSEPLYLTVRDMAIAAAVSDPRFSPVTLDELDDINIEISILSPMKRIEDPNKIIMGKHGVMVREGFRSGVYLPQVATETGWTRDEFMDSLCAQKAGIPVDSWRTGKCEIYIFTAGVFREKEPEGM